MKQLSLPGKINVFKTLVIIMIHLVLMTTAGFAAFYLAIQKT